MITARAFIEKARIPLDEKWGYIYGTQGTVWTRARQDQLARTTDEDRRLSRLWGEKWIGRRVTDCSGLIRWALRELGENVPHHARYLYTDWCAARGRLTGGLREDGRPLLPGSAVFLQGREKHVHHVGVYAGAGVVIEAKGAAYGVVTSAVDRWDHWGELKMIDYTNAAALDPAAPAPAQAAPAAALPAPAARAAVTNPNRWLNVRLGPGTQYPVRFQVEKGTVVEVLDAEKPYWRQIRLGGRIGWASAKYLTPLLPVTEPAQGPAPEAEQGPQQEPEQAPAKDAGSCAAGPEAPGGTASLPAANPKASDDAPAPPAAGPKCTDEAPALPAAGPAPGSCPTLRSVRAARIEALLRTADSLTGLAEGMRAILAELSSLDGSAP